jgi:predicted Fe-Mo cluster-binding NifX family protein
MGSPSRKRENKREIAICSFQNRVCPRFDLTREILIFDADRSQVERFEKVDVSEVSPEKIVNMLEERKVHVVISGGIQERFQEMFRRKDIDVIWGVVGEVDDVVEGYTRGVLHSGAKNSNPKTVYTRKIISY